jgi:hypothetical protein
MMKERSWIVRSVMSVIARIEKSTAWRWSGSLFDSVDVEEGKSDCVVIDIPALRIDRPSR